MMFGSTPDPGESTPELWIPSHPFIIDLIGGPLDGDQHELMEGFPVPNRIGIRSGGSGLLYWYDLGSVRRGDERGRAVFDAELTRRMAE